MYTPRFHPPLFLYMLTGVKRSIRCELEICGTWVYLPRSSVRMFRRSCAYCWCGSRLSAWMKDQESAPLAWPVVCVGTGDD